MVTRAAKAPSVRAGFSLIELLVVISIFSLISLIVLANHSKFQSGILLQSLAYDTALSVRQAQVYGLSARQSSAQSTQFQLGYGVHVASGNLLSYTLFADVNNNKRYDQGTDSIVETYTIGHGHTIKLFCAYTAAGRGDCSDGSGSGGSISFLDITFFRPDPDANFTTSAGLTYSRVTIVVSAGSTDTRTIAIASTGQISVQNP